VTEPKEGSHFYHKGLTYATQKSLKQIDDQKKQIAISDFNQPSIAKHRSATIQEKPKFSAKDTLPVMNLNNQKRTRATLLLQGLE